MKIFHSNGEKMLDCEVNKIIIYGNGKKLFEDERGRLATYEMETGKSGAEKLREIYNGGPVELYLVGDVKRAIRENLSRKDNYTMKYYPKYNGGRAETALYIHESELNSFEDLGLVLAFENDEEKQYLKAARFAFKIAPEFQKLHSERIPLAEGESWSLPAGGRWGSGYGTEAAPVYDTYDNTKSLWAKRHNAAPEKGVIKKWYTYENAAAPMICAEAYYRKTEYSPERERKMNLAEAINATGAIREKLSHYDISKLEQYFTITPKQ